MTTPAKPQKPLPETQGYICDENGEEVPITDEMVINSMAEIKLQSIGAHTGFNKVITDDMLPDLDE